MASDSSISAFFDQMRAGDREAIAKLWDRFLPRLAALARKTLAGRPLRSSDAEDVLQCALITFWQRAEQGEFSGVWNRNNIWNLLATITVRKARNHLRREQAQRRGGGRVLDEGGLSPGEEQSAARLDQQIAVLPTQEFDLFAEELLELLDDQLREIAVLRLMDYSNRDIAEMLNCTERRVERKFEKIRSLWKREVSQ